MRSRRPSIAALLAGIAFPSLVYSSERPLSTDRPDRTESPYSVPAGMFQIEMDVVSWGRVDGVDERVTGTSILAFNAKYGVTQSVDVQFLFTPWTQVRTELVGISDETDSGTGQAGLRLKINLFGNDKGRGALALLPFAFVPTRGDAVFDEVTWGMMVPLTMDIGGDRSIGTMVGVSRPGNEDTWLTGSVTFASPIVGNWAGFVELFTSVGGFDPEALDDSTIDAGVTFAPKPDWQFDAGVYRGLTSVTEDWRVFLGASFRR